MTDQEVNAELERRINALLDWWCAADTLPRPDDIPEEEFRFLERGAGALSFAMAALDCVGRPLTDYLDAHPDVPLHGLLRDLRSRRELLEPGEIAMAVEVVVIGSSDPGPSLN